ncbi:hypothetical protein [Aurantiacibacter xanthus]|uniref:hypothetical protein n=1 Tax=Aurantiacibacter xanthus TaxID=1784712 RepID=UPI0011C22EAE
MLALVEIGSAQPDQFSLSPPRARAAIDHSRLGNDQVGGITGKSRSRPEPDLADVIEAAARKVIEGHHDDQFPLAIWQTASRPY